MAKHTKRPNTPSAILAREALEQALSSVDGDTSAIRSLFAGLLDDVSRLEATNKRLSDRVQLLCRWRFGRKSEKLTLEELGQLALALGADPESPNPVMGTPAPPEERTEDAPDEGIEPKRRKAKTPRPNHKGRLELPAHLHREVTFVPVATTERTCLCCQQEMEPIGSVEHESLEFQPERLFVKVTSREKVACKNPKCQGDIVAAERSDESKMQTRAGASLLAELVETKCDDAMTLYRVQERLERLGCSIPRNTLYSNWAYALDLLCPVADAVMGEILAHDLVCVDDTHLRALDTKKGGSKLKGHLWGFVAPELHLIAYRFTETWAASEIADSLMELSGFVQVDDYKGYSSHRGKVVGPEVLHTMDAALRNMPLVDPDKRLGCCMHARRKFYDAWELGDKRCAPAITAFQELYDIEAQAKKDKLSSAERGSLRQEKSIPIFQKLIDWAQTLRGPLVPSARLAIAIDYLLQQEPFLRRCLSDGRFEIDNGEIERCLREPCIGRKNFLHAGSVQGAKRLATAYTLVQSCKLLGINTRDYLIDVMQKLAAGWLVRHVSELMPHRWAKLHERLA